MTRKQFEAEARLIALRNLTPNVAGVAAGFDSSSGHLAVTYYLFGPPTEDDEQERELTAGELIAAFPVIRSASTGFGIASEMAEASNLIFTLE